MFLYLYTYIQLSERQWMIGKVSTSLYKPVFLYECEYCNQTPCPVQRDLAKIHHTGKGHKLEGNEKIYIRLMVAYIRLFGLSQQLFAFAYSGGYSLNVVEGPYKTVIKMSSVMYIGGGHPPQIIGEDYLQTTKKNHLYSRVWLFYIVRVRKFLKMLSHIRTHESF